MAVIYSHPAVERERLAALHRFCKTTLVPDSELDSITSLAASLLEMPAAILNVGDGAWIKRRGSASESGGGQNEGLWDQPSDREGCQVVNDTTLDPRWAKHSMVTGPLGLRFYAACPLTDLAGQRMGVLAVLDFQPRILEPQHRDALNSLASLAVNRLKMLKKEARETVHIPSRPEELPSRHPRGTVPTPSAGETLQRVERLARIGSWSWDIAADAAQWSEMMYEMFLWNRESPAPQFDELRELFVPESFAIFAEAASGCVGKGTPYSVDLESIRTDGVHFFVQLRGQAVRNDQGHIVGVYGTAQDITESKRTEQTLKESEARWQLAVKSLHGGMWEWNATSGTAYYSPQWKEMLGYADGEVAPKMSAWEELVHPEDRVACLRSLEQYHHATGSIHCEAYRLRARDGGWRWIESSGIVVERLGDGSVHRVIGMHVDVTERKTAEDRIHALHERLELAIRAGQVGIWEADLVTGQFLFNEQMHEIYGVGRGSFRDGVPVNTFGGQESDWFQAAVHPEDREHVTAALKQATKTQGILEYEHRILRPGGEIRHVKSVAQVLRDAQGSPVRGIGTTLDVTEQKRLLQSMARDRERVLLATQASSIGIWEYDLKSGKLYWDEKMHSLYDTEEFAFDGTVEGWSKLLHPEDVERVAETWVTFMKERTLFESEFRIVHRSGEFRHIRALAQMFMDAEGRPQRTLGTNWDVTSEKATLAGMSTSRRASEFPVTSPTPVGSLTARKLAMVITYIDENLGQPMTLEMLAQVASISSSHFSELFRQCMGQAPHQYLMARRIEKAKDLLTRTDLPIAEIAVNLGFADQSHLTRLMRRFTGLTPRMLRARE